MKHIQLIISGKVENTGFRFYALRGASMFGIHGCVMLKNGQAILEAEGEEAQVADFTEWCRTGPEGSIVDSLTSLDKPVLNYEDFKIL